MLSKNYEKIQTMAHGSIPKVIFHILIYGYLLAYFILALGSNMAMLGLSKTSKQDCLITVITFVIFCIYIIINHLLIIHWVERKKVIQFELCLFFTLLTYYLVR